MTNEERSLTVDAIDAAYTAQIGKLFSVLCSADQADIESGSAGERFQAGLRRALTAKEMAMDATMDIIEGGL